MSLYFSTLIANILSGSGSHKYVFTTLTLIVKKVLIKFFLAPNRVL